MPEPPSEANTIKPTLLVVPESHTQPLPQPRRGARNRSHQTIWEPSNMPYTQSKLIRQRAHQDTSRTILCQLLGPSRYQTKHTELTPIAPGCSIIEQTMLQLDVQLKSDYSRLIRAAVDKAQQNSNSGLHIPRDKQPGYSGYDFSSVSHLTTPTKEGSAWPQDKHPE